MKLKRFTHVVAALALLGFGTAAVAQYVWLDEKGVKQFSDMPPPAEVPKNRILKDPGVGMRATPAPDAVAPAVPAAAPMTTTEKNAEFKKRRAEQAENDKKLAEKARLETDKVKNCARARAYNRSLESGERISRTDKNGERYFLGDEQRAQEIQENRRTMDEDCK